MRGGYPEARPRGAALAPSPILAAAFGDRLPAVRLLQDSYDLVFAVSDFPSTENPLGSIACDFSHSNCTVVGEQAIGRRDLDER